MSILNAFDVLIYQRRNLYRDEHVLFFNTKFPPVVTLPLGLERQRRRHAYDSRCINHAFDVADVSITEALAVLTPSDPAVQDGSGVTLHKCKRGGLARGMCAEPLGC